MEIKDFIFINGITLFVVGTTLLIGGIEVWGILLTGVGAVMVAGALLSDLNPEGENIKMDSVSIDEHIEKGFREEEIEQKYIEEEEE